MGVHMWIEGGGMCLCHRVGTMYCTIGILMCEGLGDVFHVVTHVLCVPIF